MHARVLTWRQLAPSMEQANAVTSCLFLTAASYLQVQVMTLDGGVQQTARVLTAAAHGARHHIRKLGCASWKVIL